VPGWVLIVEEALTQLLPQDAYRRRRSIAQWLVAGGWLYVQVLCRIVALVHDDHRCRTVLLNVLLDLLVADCERKAYASWHKERLSVQNSP